MLSFDNPLFIFRKEQDEMGNAKIKKACYGTIGFLAVGIIANYLGVNWAIYAALGLSVITGLLIFISGRDKQSGDGDDQPKPKKTASYKPMPMWVETTLNGVAAISLLLLIVYGLASIGKELHEEDIKETRSAGFAGPNGPCSKGRRARAAQESMIKLHRPEYITPLPGLQQDESNLLFSGQLRPGIEATVGHFKAGQNFQFTPAGTIQVRFVRPGQSTGRWHTMTSAGKGLFYCPEGPAWDNSQLTIRLKCEDPDPSNCTPVHVRLISI
jgi:hypothetical protein